MEELQLEFEAKSEGDEKLRGFEQEILEKSENMTTFKKTFLKFQLSVETALKKVDGCHYN